MPPWHRRRKQKTEQHGPDAPLEESQEVPVAERVSKKKKRKVHREAAPADELECKAGDFVSLGWPEHRYQSQKKYNFLVFILHFF